ncbi:MAG: nucleoside recognition domain-containing protein, partial [Oscillospiraceae bacterium]
MRHRRFFLFTLLLLGAAALLYETDAVKAAVGDGLTLCLQSVIPSLFPFFVLSSLLISLGFAEAVGRRCEGLMRPVFHVGGAGASALILGLLGGYPVGAKTVAELYRDRLCTRTEAARLLAFCNNSSPAFVLGVLGTGIFHSRRAGLALWLIHVAAALVTGLLFRRWREDGHDGNTDAPSRRPCPVRAVSLPEAFVRSVRAGLSAMGAVCAFVVCFQVLLLPLRALPLPIGRPLLCLTELFHGATLLPDSPAGFLAAAGLLGWGGLSVHCQTLSLLSDLSPKSYLLGKAAQGLLSLLFAA